ncbi:MAG TPA: tRNA (guanosine(37)-N1)-methyltransferase TrmD [Chloroflexota bacterium]|nr:tRNA (guanosine(37)-N1)-methyltransferase TrmD [Chloroflexota bacterium]
MEIDILTLFPGMFRGPFGESMLKRGVEKGLLGIRVHDLREFGLGRHKMVDDYPYGGGAGMVMKPEPLAEAIESLRRPGSTVLLTSPRGRPFTQAMAETLAGREQLLVLCGHYEGMDERVIEKFVDMEVSIGDYVLTGGEIPAMVICDAVSRLVPGVLGDDESAGDESFAGGLLEYPHYTRPLEYRGWKVPEVLLSGHHPKVAQWRREKRLLITLRRRPDLLRPEHWEELRRLGLA